MKKDLLKKLLKERGKDADLNDIDVSKITTMFNDDSGRGLFSRLDPHNIHIEYWDVSNVKDMGGMFNGCENFNCDLSEWNVSNVKDMRCMFYDCKKFTGQGLENWKPYKCKKMNYMLSGCSSLKNKPSWYHE